MLGTNELVELEDAVKEKLEDSLEEILVKLNRSGDLEDFMRLIGMESYLGIDDIRNVPSDGKIIVIGQSEVEKDKLLGVAKKLGLSKDRFELCLEYEDAKTYDFKKTQWSDKYSCILVGQMPHSGKSKGDFSCVITALENQDGYPPVVRMGSSGLKITKSSFRDALELLIDRKMVA